MDPEERLSLGRDADICGIYGNYAMVRLAPEGEDALDSPSEQDS